MYPGSTPVDSATTLGTPVQDVLVEVRELCHVCSIRIDFRHEHSRTQVLLRLGLLVYAQRLLEIGPRDCNLLTGAGTLTNSDVRAFCEPYLRDRTIAKFF